MNEYTDGRPGTDPPANPGAGAPPPPPSGAPSAPWSSPGTGVGSSPGRQLVRDPNTRLGGVASGLARYFAIDVSIVRLAFVLLTFTSGIGIMVYLLAWLVVPKAPAWPPVLQHQPVRSVTGRELAVGLLILGALAALFLNGGGTAQVLVPAALMAGGIWLLRQPEPVTQATVATPGTGPLSSPADWSPPLAEDLRPDGVASLETTMIPPSNADPSSRTASPFSSPAASQPVDTVVDPTLAPGLVEGIGSPPPPSTPPARRRRRRWGRVVFGLVLVFLLLPLFLVALVAGLLLGNGISINSDFEAIYQPQTADELPELIEHDTGEVTLDLTEFDAATLGDRTGVEIDVELGLGQIVVLVPEDLVVEVDAEAGLGEVVVFDSEDDGVNPRERFLPENPQLDIDLQVGAGQITVERR
ncbi:MAG: PspC domain-containing protein [Actinomycetota bacterium]